MKITAEPTRRPIASALLALGLSAALGLTTSTTASAETNAPASTAAAAAAAPSDILAEPYNTTLQESIPIRSGAWDIFGEVGFGYNKMRARHNMTSVDGIAWLFKSSEFRNVDSGIQFSAAVRKRVNGEVVNEIRVYGIYNDEVFDTYYGYSVDGVVGAITGYCGANYEVSNNVCPSWVNTAMAVAATGPGSDGPQYPYPPNRSTADATGELGPVVSYEAVYK